MRAPLTHEDRALADQPPSQGPLAGGGREPLLEVNVLAPPEDAEGKRQLETEAVELSLVLSHPALGDMRGRGRGSGGRAVRSWWPPPQLMNCAVK